MPLYLYAYAAKLQIAFGDAGEATSSVISLRWQRSGILRGRPRKYASTPGSKETDPCGCSAHADQSNGVEPSRSLPSNVCGRSFGTTNSLSTVRQINGYRSLCAEISVHVLCSRRAASVSRRLGDRRHAHAHLSADRHSGRLGDLAVHRP